MSLTAAAAASMLPLIAFALRAWAGQDDPSFGPDKQLGGLLQSVNGFYGSMRLAEVVRSQEQQQACLDRLEEALVGRLPEGAASSAQVELAKSEFARVLQELQGSLQALAADQTALAEEVADSTSLARVLTILREEHRGERALLVELQTFVEGQDARHELAFVALQRAQTELSAEAAEARAHTKATVIPSRASSRSRRSLTACLPPRSAPRAPLRLEAEPRPQAEPGCAPLPTE